MNDTLICKNSVLNLSVSGTGNFNWSPATNLSCTACQNPAFTALNSQTFIVTITDSNTCTNSDTLNISIAEPILDLASEYNFCIGDSITISLIDTFGYNYLWSNGATQSYTTLNSSQTIYLTVTDTFNCSKTDTCSVIERSLPSIEIKNDTTVCRDHSLVLYNSSGVTILNYLWNTGDSTSSINVIDSGYYSLLITNIYKCKNSDTVKIIEENCQCNEKHL